MVRKKLVADLDPWIATASLSLIGSFASDIIRDKAAVRALRHPLIHTHENV